MILIVKYGLVNAKMVFVTAVIIILLMTATGIVLKISDVSFPAISQKNWNCLSKEWCYALGKYSFCSSAGTCNCSKIADLDVENVFCKWNGQNDPDMCIFDYHCKYIHNGYCIDEVCGCQDDHLLQDDKCIPKIGAPCDNELTLNCPLQNSECLNGICLCTEGYVSYQNEMCYLKKDQLGDECVVDVQCSAGITNSKCVKGKCNCDDNYLPYNNTCYEKKEYNSYCDNLLQCRISLGETFACRNRMCQCPTSYTMKEDKCSSSNARSGSFFVIAFALVLKCVQFSI
ncbi:multiple epidermal growth factor-like domains protein 11 [Asbolus verrucosus]|uniref:Multiple epidermal growth factor-like domains protein 11 n=1 Tax=Asbolus verrucosus TaxID=1661398 RepID=A0A482WE49_ASBVE|nr:multiple epidermal growth factor-like domains protein 11 [Asbolus verrucosus]